MTDFQAKITAIRITSRFFWIRHHRLRAVLKHCRQSPSTPTELVGKLAYELQEMDAGIVAMASVSTSSLEWFIAQGREVDKNRSKRHGQTEFSSRDFRSS
jgi:hypothetical protein